jgi:hypothetical protein
MVLKIGDGGSVHQRACYLALAIGMDGEREVLGMWFQADEGAKFWMQVLTDLKQRGVNDILIACVDGLKRAPRSDRGSHPRHDGSDLHRSGDTSQPQIRATPPIRARHQRPPANLHRHRSGRGAARARSVRGEVGPTIARDRASMAIGMGARHPFTVFPPEVRPGWGPLVVRDNPANSLT